MFPPWSLLHGIVVLSTYTRLDYCCCWWLVVGGWWLVGGEGGRGRGQKGGGRVCGVWLLFLVILSAACAISCRTQDGTEKREVPQPGEACKSLELNNKRWEDEIIPEKNFRSHNQLGQRSSTLSMETYELFDPSAVKCRSAQT